RISGADERRVATGQGGANLPGRSILAWRQIEPNEAARPVIEPAQVQLVRQGGDNARSVGGRHRKSPDDAVALVGEGQDITHVGPYCVRVRVAAHMVRRA